VHRDLKPQNLFVCRREDGTDLLKVLDFGVAKLQAFDELNAATRTGTVMGTAAYMAPEQARGDKVVELRADVYALGAILYELLSGQLPHPGDSHNAILHHISTQPSVPLESVRPELPRELTEIVGRALASQPADRPPSAEAFGQALAPFAARKVWPAPPLTDGMPVAGERGARTPGTPVLSPPPAEVTTASLGARGATPAAPTAGDGAIKRKGLARPIVFASAALAVAAILVGAGIRVFHDRAARTPVQAPPVATVPVTAPPPAPVVPAPEPAGPAVTAPEPAVPAVSAPLHRSRRPPATAAKRAEPTPKTAPAVAPAAHPTKPRIAPVTFDEQNPYN